MKFKEELYLVILKLQIIIVTRGISSVGRAPALQAGCQEVEAPILHSRKGNSPL